MPWGQKLSPLMALLAPGSGLHAAGWVARKQSRANYSLACLYPPPSMCRFCFFLQVSLALIVHYLKDPEPQI